MSNNESNLNIIGQEHYIRIGTNLSNISLSKEYEYKRLFLWALIQRAMMISRGIEVLFDDENFEAAIPLMRVLLDCSFQLQASKLAEDEVTYCKSILSGKQIRDNKDKQGKIMSERKIAKSFEEEDWVQGIPNIYDALNKHVHFSYTHLHQIVNNDKSISLGKRMISQEPEHVENILEYYHTITTVVIYMLDSSLNDLKQYQL